MTRRHELHRIDQTLLELLDERARLLARGPGQGATGGRDDLLRRYRGALSAAAVRAFFDTVEAVSHSTGSTGSTGTAGPAGPLEPGPSARGGRS